MDRVQPLFMGCCFGQHPSPVASQPRELSVHSTSLQAAPPTSAQGTLSCGGWNFYLWRIMHEGLFVLFLFSYLLKIVLLCVA